MQTFFTSDTHFGHESIIPWCRQQFANVEDMDESLIQCWNTQVGPHDRVYHLGDFAWTAKRAKEIRPRLNGNIRLIVGNHDDIPSLCAAGLFQRVHYWRNFKEYGDLAFTASHQPQETHQLRHGVFSVHGHEHEKGSPNPTHQLNVCVENWHWQPVHVDVILDELRAKGVNSSVTRLGRIIFDLGAFWKGGGHRH